MDTPQPTADRFQIAVAILIALVTLLGATIAWRATVATDEAGDSDFAGLTATLNAERERALARINLYEDYRAYTNYLHNVELGNRIDADQLTYGLDDPNLDRQKAEVWDVAINSQSFFDNRYLNPDGSYNSRRQLGESWAEAGQFQDLNSLPHFSAADSLRTKSGRLIAVMILLSVALLLYTVAQGLNPRLNWMRYSLTFVGTLLTGLGGIAILFIDWLG